jgi:membrane-bound lytic murein transglycosylase F
MMIKALKRFSFIAFLLFVFAFSNGCDGLVPLISSSTSFSAETRTLKIATVSGTLTWRPSTASSKSANQLLGLEADLLNSFAKYAGYRIVFTKYNTELDAIKAVQNGKADVVAARLSIPTYNRFQLAPGPTFEQTPMVLVCPSSMVKKTASSLAWINFFNSENFKLKTPHKIWSTQKDSWALQSEKISKDFPNSTFSANHDLRLPKIFKWISQNANHCLIADQSEARLNLRYYPQLREIRELPVTADIGFLLTPKNRRLRSEMMSWFQGQSRSRELAVIRDRYIGHLSELNVMDSRRFLKAVQEELHELKPMFLRAADEFKLPWELIAAVAWQESQWQKEATSFTGVRGLMMLTELTAQYLGVHDRLNPEQSIWGGAKYLRYLLDKQPMRLHNRDRLAFALASYNVGPGHFMDAQNLAQDFGLNPDSWKDLKKVLPNLSDSRLESRFSFGLARGEEPVEFTNRVLNFYEILRRVN